MRKNVVSTLVAISAAATMLVGCGLSPTASVNSTAVAPVGFDAAASATLKAGFKNIHLAIFSKIDSNGDNYIDEYEAGPYFSLTKEFPNADKGSAKKGNGKISKTEFVKYTTAGGLLSGKDTPAAFMNRMRDFLAKVFSKLDKPANGSWFGKGDGYLTTEELGEKNVVALGIGFAYDKIHVKATVAAFDPGDISACDKTGDGQLSQGEFEDLYMLAVAKAINPNYQPPSPNNPPAPPAPVDPVPPATADIAASVEWWNF